MPEYIDREAVLEMLKQECSPMVFAYLADLVNAIPAADVRPVVLCRDCKTNADRIRAMSDEELADEILRWFNWLNAVEWNDKRILDWLRQEVSE